MQQEKKPRGRPPKQPETRLEQRSIRLTPAQWGVFKALGGVDWLRKLMDHAKSN